MRFMIPFLALFRVTDYARTISQIDKLKKYWVSWEEHDPEAPIAEMLRKSPTSPRVIITDYKAKLRNGKHFTVLDDEREGYRLGTVSFADEYLLIGALNQRRMDRLKQIVSVFPCTLLWQKHRVDSGHISELVEKTTHGDMTFEFVPDAEFASIPLRDDDDDEGAKAMFERSHEMIQKLVQKRGWSTTEEEMLSTINKGHTAYMLNDWPNLKVPALNGATPREAARNPAQLPQLIGLLRNLYGFHIPRKTLSRRDFMRLIDRLSLPKDARIYNPAATSDAEAIQKILYTRAVPNTKK